MKMGSFAAFADGQVDRRAVRGASGMTALLPPLRVIASVRCPRLAPQSLA
jgi:hypothetical protein